MKKVIICPAYNTKHTEVWYQWLSNNLKKQGYDPLVLEYPDISAPTEPVLVSTIKNATGSDSEPVLVGHSLGCRAILAFLNQHKVKASKVVLVGCPEFWDGIIDTRPPLANYVAGMQSIDYELVRSLVDEVHIYFGSNDHILSMKDFDFMKEKFEGKCKTFLSDTYGHYDVDEVPELLEIFK